MHHICQLNMQRAGWEDFFPRMHAKKRQRHSTQWKHSCVVWDIEISCVLSSRGRTCGSVFKHERSQNLEVKVRGNGA